jgi:hypothetical protein
VTALVDEVFAHRAGQSWAAAVTTFLRRQHLASLRCGTVALAALPVAQRLLL